MTKREEAALEILRAGGYFRRALETGYLGREKFHTRLYDAGGWVVPGFGFSTYHKLSSLLTYKACESSSTWPTAWKLA